MSNESSKKQLVKMEGSHVVMEKEKKALEFLEYVTANADEVQKQVLAEILTRNANVEYLQRHGLGGRTDTNSFKKFVPVITYEDIQPDINRIANGDKSPILCAHPISEFLTRLVVQETRSCYVALSYLEHELLNFCLASLSKSTAQLHVTIKIYKFMNTRKT